MRFEALNSLSYWLIPLTSMKVSASDLNTPAFVATQLWIPLSFTVTLLIAKSSSICWLLPTGSWPPCFFQVTTGRGSPVALQFKTNIPPTHATTLAGGLTANRGGETTTKRVFVSTHYRNAPIEKRRPWKVGYPLGFASKHEVSKTTVVFGLLWTS